MAPKLSIDLYLEVSSTTQTSTLNISKVCHPDLMESAFSWTFFVYWFVLVRIRYVYRLNLKFYTVVLSSLQISHIRVHLI